MMLNFRATTQIGAPEVVVEVYFDYTAEEPAVLYPIDKAYPGYGPEVTINKVVIKKSQIDILSVLSQKIIDDLEVFCFEFIENLREYANDSMGD